MIAMKRMKRVFAGTSQVQGDRLFRTYFGSLLYDNEGIGPTAEEARRDLQQVRWAVSRARLF